jgi:hypothetical protein
MFVSQAADILRSSGGRFVSLAFIKRSTGQERRMLCRLGVRRYLKGGTLAFSPDDHGLMVVWSVHDQGYRSVPVNSITAIRHKGIWHTVTPDELPALAEQVRIANAVARS